VRDVLFPMRVLRQLLPVLHGPDAIDTAVVIFVDVLQHLLELLARPATSRWELEIKEMREIAKIAATWICDSDVRAKIHTRTGILRHSGQRGPRNSILLHRADVFGHRN
jgi:hypothetical protein